MWEGDDKNLPIMVLPPRGPASSPWVTMFVDDATRVIIGWAIALTPHAGTVLTALRMGTLPDDTGPGGGVPGMLRLDHGLEFAADSVRDAAHALGVEMAVMRAYHPNAKGKIERANRSVDQILLSMLLGFLEAPASCPAGWPSPSATVRPPAPATNTRPRTAPTRPICRCAGPCSSNGSPRG